MGGIDWAALPIIADMIGFTDIERLIIQLAVVRDHQHQEN